MAISYRYDFVACGFLALFLHDLHDSLAIVVKHELTGLALTLILANTPPRLDVLPIYMFLM
ncbi:hypothetical protein [Campylobacter fetus]|uniref:hypothetical protein n=1 Tax=Campylobacter fetus TaxID=196 RepID=UPI000FCB543B|nr:hypothetical protein [Campylobacter fetus]RUT50620.1 hypothetical protein BWK67_05425 [Campylobacter fetus]RUT50937.1 hypothetical protein BWK51_05405 [Campylobacter fetus]